ncbi:ABC transporter permease [Bacillus badius]|uniref:ABC transporter permease n=1 Tax=Bacillus badius TaxID=1455 RepID=UPI000597E0B0|nr:ABC transporter permease [Bacillus badius]KIL73933.1 Bacitracin export permease protein BceB [Bacillus badius]
MTLSSIAFRNIKRNFKDYFLYFTSMIVSIVSYFTFKTLQYNSQMVSAANDSNMVSNAFKIASVMLIIFVSIFIVYSNSFFTRKRKKEVGLYSLLGIRKKQIGKMLFYENLLMGLLALLVGIVIGSLLSKVFLELLVSMMELNLNVHFEVPVKAVLDTTVIFFLIILYTSVQGYRLIHRFKLIELFRAEQEGETIPKGSIIMAFLSVGLVGSGYFLSVTATKDISSDNFLFFALYIVLATVLGTYLLFTFFTIFVLKRARVKKSSFYKGIKMVATSQLLYRIRGNAKSLATIAILSAVTLTSVGASVTMYYNTFVQAKKVTPFSYSYEIKDTALNNKINTIIDSEKNNHPVTEQFELEMVPVKGNFEGETADTANRDKTRNFHYYSSESYQLVSQSTFNTLAEKMNTEAIYLNAGEAFVYDNTYVEGYKYSAVYKGNKVVFPVGNEMKTLTIQGAEGRGLTNLGELVVVVPDDVYKQAKKVAGTRIVKNVNVKNERSSKELTEELQKALPVPSEEMQSLESFKDFYTDFRRGIEATGVMMFIGVFLGLVFLLATGSIIYFKQLTEANADRERYVVLRKIGVTKREMKVAIAKQVRFVFVMPLVIGILHSLFALIGLSTVMPYEILIPLLMSIGAYSLIYLGYYFLTVHSYFNIVSRK